MAVASLTHAEWRQTSTDHFTFIYQDDYEFAAQELVGFADEVYDEVAPLFDSAPHHINAVVFGETDLANGYFDPNPPQHIGLFVVQPSTTWIGAEAESWLRLLLVHEVTHYLQANHAPGLFTTIGAVFGESLGALDIGLVPLWLTEGLAIHAESARSSGGRQDDPEYEVYERALTLEDRMFSLEQAGYSSHLAPPGRQYVAGKFLIDYMVERFGEEFISVFMDEFSAFPLFGMWGPVERATGVSMDEIYSQAVGWLSQQYAEYRSLPSGPRVTPSVTGDYYLPMSTAHGWYLYRRRPDRRTGVVRFHDGSEELLLPVRLTDPHSWSVTPDGMLIAFATVSVDRTASGDAPLLSDLYLHNVDGGRTRRLTDGGGYFQPAVTPDGSAIFAVQRVSGYHQVVRISPADGEEQRIVLGEPGTRYYKPALSPDGRLLAVAENRGGNQRIALVELSTGIVTRLPRPVGTGAPLNPAFMDNESLLYSVELDGTLSLIRHDLGDNTVELIGQDRVGINEAAGIDGTILYRAYTSDGFAVRQLEPSAPQALETVQTGEPAALQPPAPVTSTPYSAIAWPQYWLPTIGLSGGVLLPEYLGGGLTVAGRNIFGTTGWTAQALYFPAISQIGYSASVSADLGPALLTFSAESTYEPVPAPSGDIFVQRFTQGVAASIDIVNDFYLGASRQVGLTGEISTQFAAASSLPFGVHDLSSQGVTPQTPLFIPSTGFLVARNPIAAMRAATAPWAAGLQAQASLPLSIETGALETVFLRGVGFVNLGVGGSHVIRLQPEATWASTPAYSAPFTLRGFGPRTLNDADGPGHFKLAAEYLPPHLLTDIPLLSSVGITRFGFELFYEMTGGFSPKDGSVALDNAIAFGVGLTTVITYLVDWPVTIGLAARVRPAADGYFGPGDFALYFDVDLLQSLGTIGSTFNTDHETIHPTHSTDLVGDWTLGE